MSLYQKYRPQNFSDLVGQDAIKKTLINALKHNNISHAYLFVGPRGTGKTTTARLLAKAINCQNRKEKTAEPCNNCANCKEITSGHSLDVIEIDAASNRGIDEIRDLREKIRYAPAMAKYKVFIIDEVHMLTKESFNALLKTLEEPPKHAIFIMATTEPEKVPETILSRVQEFDFKRATIKEIEEDLGKIINLEKFDIDKEAITLIARFSEGSFRDAESILDQVSSSSKNKITVENVQEVMGIVADNITGDFVEFLMQKNINEAVRLIDKIYVDGYDLGDFTNRVVEYFRNLMLIYSNLDLSTTISESELPRMTKIVSCAEPKTILNFLNRFLKVIAEIKFSKVPQLPIELAVYDLIVKEHRTSSIEHRASSIEHRASSIEHRASSIEHRTSGIEHRASSIEHRASSIEHRALCHTEKEKVLSNKININLTQKWPQVISAINEINHSLAMLLKDAEPIEIKDKNLIIAVKFKFYAERLADKKNHQIICKILSEVCGDNLSIICQVREQIAKKDAPKANNLVDEALEIFA